MVMRRTTHMHRDHKRAAGFTLIELLVVIAIIAILAALLTPTLGAARRGAQTSSSQSNLRQIHLMFRMYLNDKDGAFPTARGLHLESEKHWRRVIWEHSRGPFTGGGGDIIQQMESSAYATVLWCPMMTSRNGKDQHPYGRGSYGINRYFMDPTWGGGYRFEEAGTLVGAVEPFIMAGTLHPADARFGTDAHIDSSSYPYDTAWANMAYEYGRGGDRALALYLDGHSELMDRDRGVTLHPLISNPNDFQ
jgi:prepilin-type N-terminal cleavage/methylation domain-containing protein